MDESESKTERGTSPQATSKTIADKWLSVKQAIHRFCSSETPVETDVSMFEEDPSSAFELKRLFPLAVVCLGFGWLLAFLFGALNVFIDSGNKYAILPLGALALFGAIISFLHFVRPKTTNWIVCIGIAIFTAVVGIKILGTIQPAAIRSVVSGTRPAGGIFGLFIKLIGYAYVQLDNENVSRLGKLFGNVFGVGLCEESVKLLPIFLLVVFRNRLPFKLELSFRSILVFGFFSGIGFGVAEALTDAYCLIPVEQGPFTRLWIQEKFEGGISPEDLVGAWETYENYLEYMAKVGVENRMAFSQVIRWFACVPSHAIYTVIDVSFLWMLYHHIKEENDARFQLLWYVGCVGACAVLHGVYNTFCDIFGLGFVFDAISLVLVWFVIRRAINVKFGGIDESDSSLENFREKSVSTFGKTFAKVYLCLFVGTIVFFAIHGGDNPLERMEKNREYWTRRIVEHWMDSASDMEEEATEVATSRQSPESAIPVKPSNMYEDLLAGRISLPSFYKHSFDKEYCEFYRTDGGVLDPNADLWNQRMRAAREEYAKEHPEAGIRLSSGKRNLYEDVMEGRVTLPTFYRHAFDAETGEFYRTDGRTLDPQAALWNKRMQLAREEYESQNKQ